MGTIINYLEPSTAADAVMNPATMAQPDTSAAIVSTTGGDAKSEHVLPSIEADDIAKTLKNKRASSPLIQNGHNVSTAHSVEANADNQGFVHNKMPDSPGHSSTNTADSNNKAHTPVKKQGGAKRKADTINDDDNDAASISRKFRNRILKIKEDPAPEPPRQPIQKMPQKKLTTTTGITDPNHWLRDDELVPILGKLIDLYSSRSCIVDSLLTASPERYTQQGAAAYPRIVEKIRTAQLLVLPLNFEQHWVVVVIRRSNEGEVFAIDLYDSYKCQANVKKAKSLVRKFLSVFLPKSVDQLGELFREASVPNQGNTVDCGVAVFACVVYAMASISIPARIPAHMWRAVIQRFSDPSFALKEHIVDVLVKQTKQPKSESPLEWTKSSIDNDNLALECVGQMLRIKKVYSAHGERTFAELQSLLQDVACTSEVLKCVVNNALVEDLPYERRKQMQDGAWDVVDELDAAREAFREKLRGLKENIDSVESAGKFLEINRDAIQAKMRGLKENIDSVETAGKFRTKRDVIQAKMKHRGLSNTG
jgi:Ulp1 family protease catalytic subunit